MVETESGSVGIDNGDETGRAQPKKPSIEQGGLKGAVAWEMTNVLIPAMALCIMIPLGVLASPHVSVLRSWYWWGIPMPSAAIFIFWLIGTIIVFRGMLYKTEEIMERAWQHLQKHNIEQGGLKASKPTIRAQIIGRDEEWAQRNQDQFKAILVAVFFFLFAVMLHYGAVLFSPLPQG